MNGNISKRKGLASSVDADSLNYISEKVSEKLTGYTAAVASEEAARTEADKALEGEILKKQDKLTFDTAPTAESENPVTSRGIKDELDKKVDKADGKVLSSNDFTDEDKAKLDKKVDKADGMGLSKIKNISLEKMTIASSPGGVLAKCEMLDIETQSGEKILASYVPETHLKEFGHPNKCVTKSKLSDELQAEMDKISTKADKSDTYTKDEVDNKINSVDLSGKQDKLIFDTTPTENSENPVTSGGIKNALDNHVKLTDYGTTQKAGVVKSSGSFGFGINASGYGYIMKATKAEIDARKDNYKPIVPSYLDYAVRSVPYFNIITEITDNTLLLANRQEARLTSTDVETLTVTMPETVPSDYESAFSFKSGATATVFSYSSLPIVWKGDDCDSEGNFIPVANTSYEINVKRVGTESEIIARVGAY